LSRLGSRFVYAADELYLLGGVELPPARAYEGFPILEDGVGLVRRFTDGFLRSVRRLPPASSRQRRVSVVTGELFAPRMSALLEQISTDGLHVSVVPTPNAFFGGTISVAGLLTGQDILRALAGRPVGDLVLVPGVALKDGEGVFLDDLTPGDLELRLGVRVRAVAPSPRALLRALLDPLR
jgi:NifB/MoaA-like Fe-S oxidoreductase